MNAKHDTITIRMVPVDKISVANPRVRNKKIFQQIVDSISKVGLKKPITVRQTTKGKSRESYRLVCGQGRLEAFISLGQHDIPAICIDATEEEGLVMSLVENIARRQHHPMELLHDIGELGRRGYSNSKIATKTGLTISYVRSIRKLIGEGEEKLLTAVEAGHIPFSVALDIAETDAKGAQDALAQAYQDGHLRGRKLLMAKRLVEQREKRGKSLRGGKSVAVRSAMSSKLLVRAYENEANRQRLLIKKAEIAQSRLLFIVEAMRQLLASENFVTLLRAEGLETIPRPLADLISPLDTL